MIRFRLFFVLVATTLFLSAQNDSFCNELKAITDIVETSHYRPKPVNDSLSKAVFNLFINQIDESKRFFTQADIAVFKNDELYLDNYIQKDNCSFIDGYVEVLESRVKSSKVILENIKSKELKYKSLDSLNYNTIETINYFKNEASAERYWNKKVRYKILQKLVENDSVLIDIKSNFKTLEADVKQKIIDNEICLLNELEQSKSSIRRFVEEAFLDAYLKYQDPNSAYLSASDKVLFEQSVANSQSTFGIQTSKKKNGDIIISHISPGSSAFKNGNLDVNDIIIALSNSTETIETYCTSNATIERFINNEHTNEITFKVKKKDGQVLSIQLKKSAIKVETNTIIGYILHGEKQIGYLSIPSFYTDTESINGLGVSNDVAKQIYKLQREHIEGLIIDLRFNGGGSMKEATELSGMFIDRGPVAISKVRGEESFTLRDPNRGTVFSKPMVILVDQFSASASEFFAGAMQDYNSAVIVGSKTHGKATSQVIGAINPDKPSNFIKLTTGQFFRVTGKSHQQTGVVPDISLPTIYDNYKTQETHLPFSIENSEIEVKLKHRPKAKKDLNTIVANSKNRVKNSSAFKAIKAFNHVFVDTYINRVGKYPLSLEFVFNDKQQYSAAWEAYNAALKAVPTHFKVTNTVSTTALLEYNIDDKNQNKTHREDLSKDPYIQEAYHIINELLQL